MSTASDLAELEKLRDDPGLQNDLREKVVARINALRGEQDALAGATAPVYDHLRDRPWERPLARPDSESTKVDNAAPMSVSDVARVGALKAGRGAEFALGGINSSVGMADDLITGGIVQRGLRAAPGPLADSAQAISTAKQEHPYLGVVGGSALAAATPGGFAKGVSGAMETALGIREASGLGKLALRILQGAGTGATVKAGQNVVAGRPAEEDIGGAAALGGAFSGAGAAGEFSAENIRAPSSPLAGAIRDVESGGGKLGTGGPLVWAQERLSRIPGMGGLAPKLKSVPGYNTRVPADVAENFQGPKEVEVPRSAAKTVPPPAPTDPMVRLRTGDMPFEEMKYDRTSMGDKGSTTPNAPVRLEVYDDGVAIGDGRHRLMEAAARGQKQIQAEIVRYDQDGNVVDRHQGIIPTPKGDFGAPQRSPEADADVRGFEDFWRSKNHPPGVGARPQDLVGRMRTGEPPSASRSVSETLEHPEDVAADKAARGLAPEAYARTKGIPKEFGQIREIYANTPEGQVEQYPEATQSEFLRMVRSLSHSKTSGLPERGLPGKLPLVDRETPTLALNNLFQIAKPGEANSAGVKFETMSAEEARSLGFKVPRELTGDVAVVPRKTNALSLDRIRNAIDDWMDANSKRLPPQDGNSLMQAVREDQDRFPWPESKLGPAPEATLEDGTVVRGLSALRHNEGKAIGANQRRMAAVGVTNPKASEEDMLSALLGSVKGYGQPGRITQDRALNELASTPELRRLLQSNRTISGMKDVAAGAPGGLTNRGAIIRKAQVQLDPFAQQLRDVAPHVGRGAATLTKEQRDAMLRELTFGRYGR